MLGSHRLGCRKQAHGLGHDLDAGAPLAAGVPCPRSEPTIDGDPLPRTHDSSAAIRLAARGDDADEASARAPGADDGEPERAEATIVAEGVELGVGGDGSGQTDAIHKSSLASRWSPHRIAAKTHLCQGDDRPLECGKPPTRELPSLFEADLKRLEIDLLAL